MDRLNPLSPSSYPSALGAQAAVTPAPPRELTLAERIEKLESGLISVDKAHSDQLNILADKIIRLENRVG